MLMPVVVLIGMASGVVFDVSLGFALALMTDDRARNDARAARLCWLQLDLLTLPVVVSPLLLCDASNVRDDLRLPACEGPLPTSENAFFPVLIVAYVMRFGCAQALPLWSCFRGKTRSNGETGVRFWVSPLSTSDLDESFNFVFVFQLTSILHLLSLNMSSTARHICLSTSYY
jgi:hypothetical protein